MKRKALPYTEGDWFALPLRDSGHAIGLIARAAPSGRVLFGYFFGPRLKELPELDVTRDLKPEDALLLGMFGDLYLLQGRWPVLGRDRPWRRGVWPMPMFGRVDEVSGAAWIVRYDEDMPSRQVCERACSVEQARGLPKDAVMGAGAAEIRLTKLLSTLPPSPEGPAT